MGIFAGTNNFRGYGYGIELPDGFLPVAIPNPNPYPYYLGRVWIIHIYMDMGRVLEGNYPLNYIPV